MSENPVPPSSPLDYMKPSGAGYSGPAPTKEECNMGMLIYILSIVTGFIGPLIIWLMKKDQSPYLNDQGKESLNWIITVILVIIISIPLMFILVGFITYFGILIAHLVLTIMAAMKANKGIAYRYPLALRLLK